MDNKKFDLMLWTALHDFRSKGPYLDYKKFGRTYEPSGTAKVEVHKRTNK